jgi:signal-transduction protein with cAMP-binding, CBS, and nucleotidyltransferase domain
MAPTFVKDVMNNDLAELETSTPIKDAAQVMTQKNIGCIIVTKYAIPVGILTERDFVKRITAKEIPLHFSLDKAMSSPLIAIGPDETVWKAAEVMKIKNIHKLPVRQDDQVIGIITTTDLIKICSLGSDSEMRRMSDQIITRMEQNK